MALLSLEPIYSTRGVQIRRGNQLLQPTFVIPITRPHWFRRYNTSNIYPIYDSKGRSLVNNRS